MKKYAIAVAILAAFGFVSPASAADWTGRYIGLNAGGNLGRSQVTTADVGTNFCCGLPAQIASTGNQSFHTSGFTGGVQGGYNWQFGNVLLGGELDFEYFRNAGSTSVTATDICCAPQSLTIGSSVSTDWLFTARPRLGWVQNNWLFYGTGGLAVTSLKTSWHFSETSGPSAASASASTIKTGWTVGGGIETMLPGKWVIGAEYLYVNFGSTSASSLLVGGVAADTFNNTADLKANIVRARLSKMF